MSFGVCGRPGPDAELALEDPGVQLDLRTKLLGSISALREW